MSVLNVPACSSYLFLQGPASLFFNSLATALRDRGHQVWRINFNGGDRAFWRQPGALDYTGSRPQFPAFLMRQFVKLSVTDIVLLGDCRPLHKMAIDAARLFGVRTHIFEQGYIRPNWITLEHDGVNGFSSLPRDIASYMAMARPLEGANRAVEVAATLPKRALDDVIYSVSTMLMGWRYPKFERHWPYGQLEEYWYGGRRLLARLLTMRRRQQEIAALIASRADYYVFPLQVDVDSQIIFHSHFTGQGEVIDSVMQSFVRGAPPDALLVFTEHPLETSPTNWRELVMKQARHFGVSSRVRFFAGGSPPELLAAARGIVVVNSTTGHLGLELGVPVVALGPAIFNVAGMTFQDGLDQFWTEARPASLELVDAFRTVVIDRTQLNGGFFNKRGIELAVANAIPRMLAASGGAALTQHATIMRVKPVTQQSQTAIDIVTGSAA